MPEQRHRSMARRPSHALVPHSGSALFCLLWLLCHVRRHTAMAGVIDKSLIVDSAPPPATNYGGQSSSTASGPGVGRGSVSDSTSVDSSSIETSSSNSESSGENGGNSSGSLDGNSSKSSDDVSSSDNSDDGSTSNSAEDSSSNSGGSGSSGAGTSDEGDSDSGTQSKDNTGGNEDNSAAVATDDDRTKGLKCEPGCLHGGVCQLEIPKGGVGGGEGLLEEAKVPVCVCPAPDPNTKRFYRGRSCQTEATRCNSTWWCENGGDCKPLFDGSQEFSCSCPVGFEGAKCQAPVTLCGMQSHALWCANGGVCVKSLEANATICKCPSTHTGAHCQTLVEPQELGPTHSEQSNFTSPVVLPPDEAVVLLEDEHKHYFKAFFLLLGALIMVWMLALVAVHCPHVLFPFAFPHHHHQRHRGLTGLVREAGGHLPLSHGPARRGRGSPGLKSKKLKIIERLPTGAAEAHMTAGEATAEAASAAVASPAVDEPHSRAFAGAAAEEDEEFEKLLQQQYHCDGGLRREVQQDAVFLQVAEDGPGVEAHSPKHSADGRTTESSGYKGEGELLTESQCMQSPLEEGTDPELPEPDGQELVASTDCSSTVISSRATAEIAVPLL